MTDGNRPDHRQADALRRDGGIPQRPTRSRHDHHYVQVGSALGRRRSDRGPTGQRVRRPDGSGRQLPAGRDHLSHCVLIGSVTGTVERGVEGTTAKTHQQTTRSSMPRRWPTSPWCRTTPLPVGTCQSGAAQANAYTDSKMADHVNAVDPHSVMPRRRATPSPGRHLRRGAKTVTVNGNAGHPGRSLPHGGGRTADHRQVLPERSRDHRLQHSACHSRPTT